MKIWKKKKMFSLAKQILDPDPLEKWDPDPYLNVLDPPHRRQGQKQYCSAVALKMAQVPSNVNDVHNFYYSYKLNLNF